MTRSAFLAGLCVLLLAPPAANPAAAQQVTGVARPSDLSAQTQRPRLRVNPRGERLLYRDCEFKLVQQYRPSGTVIVPWQRCWWVRG
jgi:hypothetical protein